MLDQLTYRQPFHSWEAGGTPGGRNALLLDVLANDGKGSSAAASGKIARGPESTTPKLGANGGMIGLANETT